jgi:two-component system sensor histidine kinase QseC
MIGENTNRSVSTWSLKGAFLGVFILSTIVFFSFSTFVIYQAAALESQELFDDALEESAHLLLALAGHEVNELGINIPNFADETGNQGYQKYLVFQIWSADNRLLYKSVGAPIVNLAKKETLGFDYTTIGGQKWRTYSKWNAAKNLRIEVSEPSGHRKEISDEFVVNSLYFALLTFPLMCAVAWWAINRILRSLKKSEAEVLQRTPGDLCAVNLSDAPIEVFPLLNAINQLFERVNRTLDYEHRFMADAAHEIRTPLAAIKTNLQVMQKARNEGERAEAISGLEISVDRAARLVDQMLILARLDPKYDRNEVLVQTDLSALITTQMPALQQMAKKMQLHFHVHLEPALCFLHQDSFLILMRNLMDNAFRYTPPGGYVRLSCRKEGDDICMTIVDSGAGIPLELRERVFDRFVRLSDPGIQGSGLGLSIVKRIVESHQGKISLSNGINQLGLSVEVRLPVSLSHSSNLA